MACVGKYLAQLVKFPRHSAVVPWSLTMAWAVRSMPSLLLAVWSTIFTRSKGAQIVFARQPLLPPSTRSLANSAGPTPDLVTDIFVILERAGGVLALLLGLLATFERRFVPFF